MSRVTLVFVICLLALLLHYHGTFTTEIGHNRGKPNRSDCELGFEVAYLKILRHEAEIPIHVKLEINDLGQRCKYSQRVTAYRWR